MTCTIYEPKQGHASAATKGFFLYFQTCTHGTTQLFGDTFIPRLHKITISSSPFCSSVHPILSVSSPFAYVRIDFPSVPCAMVIYTITALTSGTYYIRFYAQGVCVCVCALARARQICRQKESEKYHKTKPSVLIFLRPSAVSRVRRRSSVVVAVSCT